MAAVQLNQVSKKYGRKIGISGIDLTLEKGDIFGLIGPDSAGKTTILRILMNYIFPSDGEVTVFDQDVTVASKSLKKDMVYVPADICFYHNMKIGKYIKLTLKAHKKKKNSKIAKLIKAFDIDTGERFEDMDKSEQKKAALAVAIAMEPALLLLDEPTRGLDAKATQLLFECLAKLQENGSTVLITGRDADEYYGLCNRFAIIENGEITVDADTFFAENPECFEGMAISVTAAEETEADDSPEEEFEDAEAEIDDFSDTIEIPSEIEEETEEAEEAEATENSEEISEEEAVPAEDEEALSEEAELPEADETEEADTDTAEDEKADTKPQYDFSKPVEEEESENEIKKHKNITMKSIGFNRDAFNAVGAKVVSEEAGKIVLEYSGDLDVLAKLLYDLDMDDICISSRDLQEKFLPFFEGGDAE